MIRKNTTLQYLIGFLIVLLLSSSGCTIKATLDTTTDGVTEFASSTTGKSWWTEDGLVKNGEHPRAFVATNHGNLLQDMARGEGEYLVAFGNVLGVSLDQREQFHSIVQERYPELATINIHRGPGDLNNFIDKVHHLRPLSK